MLDSSYYCSADTLHNGRGGGVVVVRRGKAVGAAVGAESTACTVAVRLLLQYR